jgi:hypothetical protein
MFNPMNEKTLPLNQAAQRVPPSRGKKTHISTLLRWITRGAKSPDGAVVRLEALRLGGRWLTSEEALQRFSQKLTPTFPGDTVPAPRSPAARTRASERAAAALEALGI